MLSPQVFDGHVVSAAIILSLTPRFSEVPVAFQDGKPL
jgi:hypothetical protein